MSTPVAIRPIDTAGRPIFAPDFVAAGQSLTWHGRPLEAIPLAAVTSSNIRAIGYDAEARHLAVAFTNGSLYHFANVAPEQFAAFQASPSKGSYFYKFIRGKYVGQRFEVMGPPWGVVVGTDPRDEARCPRCSHEGREGEPCDQCGQAVYQL